jgi:mannobiose 2-epimerase
METPRDLARLAAEAGRELTEHLLPYWATRALDERHGGFVGRIDGYDRPVPDAPKGAVLNARILWTFAAAARALDDVAYRGLAGRAFAYLCDHFADGDHGGVYWTLRADGTPLDPKKQVYAQAFAIYALAEYVRLGTNEKALAWAQELFRLLEARAADPEHGGYFEAFSRAWGPLGDVRLSEKDEAAPKSMNTHLHVLEAYTALYRVWPDAGLAAALRTLVELFLDRIVDAATGHLRCFFAAGWTPVSRLVSFGHDIEASWLLDEAADATADPELQARVRAVSVRLARVTLDEGVDADGGLLYEVTSDGHLDDDKHWWPQAEAAVGFLNAYGHTEDPAFAEAALRAGVFIRAHVVDRAGGEWFARLSRGGVPYRGEDKVGPWKCPYHNARACLEVMGRVRALEPLSATSAQ